MEILVIGGNAEEYELQAINYLSANSKLSFLDFNAKNFDLNHFHSIPEMYKNRFDLVLCSQVLEHVWNHENFFKNVVLKYLSNVTIKNIPKH